MSTRPIHECAHKLTRSPRISRRVLGALPVKCPSVFQNSGDEAMHTAMKLGWYYWNAGAVRRRKSVRASRYHGSPWRRRRRACRTPRDFDASSKLRMSRVPSHRYGKHGEAKKPSPQPGGNLEPRSCAKTRETIGAFIANRAGRGGVIPPRNYVEKISRY